MTHDQFMSKAFEERVLEKTRFAAQSFMSEAALDTLEMHRAADMMGEQLAMSIHGYLMSGAVQGTEEEELEESVEKDPEEIPVTWWDAFKLRWFPRWLRRKYPPITRTIIKTIFKKATIRREYIMCPHTPMLLPRGGRDVRIPVISTQEWLGHFEKE